jgi:hypothetical protein
MRWHLFLEEYGVKLEYLSGNKQRNVVAYVISHLDIDS